MAGLLRVAERTAEAARSWRRVRQQARTELVRTGAGLEQNKSLGNRCTGLRRAEVGYDDDAQQATIDMIIEA